jgi:GTP cyclohydrolase IV
MSEITEVFTPTASDAQARRPQTQLSLTRVGVNGVEKVLRVRVDSAEQLYYAQLECVVDLNPQQAGVHMSRFEEVFNETIDEVVLGEAFKSEILAAHIATRVRERQEGMRAEVTIAARYPETVPAPASGHPTQELYTLYGTAVASDKGTRTLTGVQAQGMTACPCAQGLVSDRARERLAAKGLEPALIDDVLEAVPIATHNQRGLGTLYVGRPEDSEVEIDAPDLLRVVEQSMSSEIYELMKRSDELAVVEKAHANPRFVEDCVREMIRRVVEAYPELDDSGFVCARQENLETIHRHNVVAERTGLVGEIRAELESGEHSRHHLTMREWLEAPSSPSPR